MSRVCSTTEQLTESTHKGVNLNLKRPEFILSEWHRDHTFQLPSPVSGELKIILIFMAHNLHEMGRSAPAHTWQFRCY